LAASMLWGELLLRRDALAFDTGKGSVGI
jgi:hypothetical protein